MCDGPWKAVPSQEGHSWVILRVGLLQNQFGCVSYIHPLGHVRSCIALGLWGVPTSKKVLIRYNTLLPAPNLRPSGL
jgi:hypothetical protein